MLGLPRKTEVNREIPRNKIFTRAIQTNILREIYDEQILRIVWKNKLSSEILGITSESSIDEIEVFSLDTKSRSIDKRILRQIDRAIPYYLFHVLCYDNRYQACVANKFFVNGSIRIENYSRSLWLDKDNFDFSFKGDSIDKIYRNLKEQVIENRNGTLVIPRQIEECDEFMRYFRTMKMTRSYKPVLILAALQYGGSITVEQAAKFFVKFYQGRKAGGKIAEYGNCIYSDDPDNTAGIINNLIHNPIKALCGSGFFSYNSSERVFSFANDIYDGLTMREIDEIGQQCTLRLKMYYREIT